MPTKLNFGSGPKRIKGFIGIDALPWKGVTDIVWDLIDIPYTFVTEPADEIMAIEFLEHISFRHTLRVLKEWYRILKVGGKLTIQVPAIDKMCEMFSKGEICDCVKHKPQNDEEARGKKDCWECKGKGKINPIRWLMAFCGAQKHPRDIHRNVFTKDILRKNLQDAGFRDVVIKYDKYEWKLKAVCYK